MVAPVQALSAAESSYAEALVTQQAVLEYACRSLHLEPAASGAAPGGTFTCTSADGKAGAALQAFHGPGVHWLSASGLASGAFGICRLLAFCAADRDVPHLALEQSVVPGGQMQGIITILPRQDYTTDLDYLHTYFASGTPGLRPYNELMNEAYDTAAARPGWRHYQSPVAKVKPLLASSIAYQFPADSGNLELFRAWALEAAQLWAAFLQGGGSAPRDERHLHAYDARYMAAVTSDPDNHIAVRLFGEQACDSLIKLATGHPSVRG